MKSNTIANTENVTIHQEKLSAMECVEAIRDLDLKYNTGKPYAEWSFIDAFNSYLTNKKYYAAKYYATRKGY